MKLQGIFSPITTPFNHEGEMWKVKVQHNIEKWNATGLRATWWWHPRARA